MITLGQVTPRSFNNYYMLKGGMQAVVIGGAISVAALGVVPHRPMRASSARRSRKGFPEA
jgi:hypothetical protein